MKCYYSWLFFAVMIVSLSCSKQEKSGYWSSSVHNLIRQEIDSVFPDSLRDTIVFYVERSACHSCKEKFWRFYSGLEKPPVVIQQLDNKRVQIKNTVPDYVKDVSRIMPYYSDVISKHLNQITDRAIGVYKITVGDQTISSIELFMK